MNPDAHAARVLVVDDEDRNRRVLAAMLEHEGYAVVEAASGEEAVASAQINPPDLVLLDIMMPGMDGYEVARQLKTADATRTVPIIMVTALGDRGSRVRGLEAGAEEFVTKPIDRWELRVRVKNLLKLKEYGDFLANMNRILDDQVRERSKQLVASYRETIATMTRASAYKDEETGAHVARISHYTVEIARALQLGDTFCDIIHYASPMHDVGKIAIPDAILGKTSKFEPHEWEIMKSHAMLGARLLHGSNSPYLTMGAEIAGGHHERWDGSGYPLGLEGEAIPLSARVMCICDQYDALRSRRPYKPPFTHERAVEIITVGDGRTSPSHFDPMVLQAFKARVGRLREIYEAYADAD